MNDHERQADPYEVVLADLRAQRDKIDQTIALISSIRGLSAPEIGAKQAQSVQTVEAVQDAGSMFLGMSIPEAVLKLLAARKRKMTNAEILAELKAGGLELSSQDPLNVIGSVLSRRFHSVGDIVRVDRGTWGLKSWYPGRNFKGKAVAGEKAPLEESASIVEDVDGATETVANILDDLL